MAKKSFETRTRFSKFNEELGIVFGYAIVCSENGEPYFDTQGDHIPEDAMIKAATDFMLNSRVAKEMHGMEGYSDEPIGEIVFAFPVTADIAEAFGFTVNKTGLIIGMKPSPAHIEKFRKGDFTGFSIGGNYVSNEEVED